jgi:predicted nucleic acid-binding protein
MIEVNSVFFDTSPFIYLIEDNQKYSSSVANYIADMSLKEVVLTRSVITVSEFQVNPKKLMNLKPIEDFNRLIDQFSIHIFDITLEIAELSASLRAKYVFLKTMDAMQLATAINHSCKSFITNDFKLKKIEEINIITVVDL